MSRYAAKLLFQFRFGTGSDDIFRKIERRIVVFKAEDADRAYSLAEKYAKNEEYDFVNDDGSKVFFEFVGVEDLMHLGLEADEHEVWYEIGRMKTPMERAETLIPPRDTLSAFTYEKNANR